MSLFANLGTEGLEKAEDRVGGGYSPQEADIYGMTIKVAYASTATSGAKAVNIIGDINGTEYRETIYVTNKAGENFFLNKQDSSKKVPLPGFTTINDICLIVAGKELKDVAIEEKTIKLWDYDAKAELPKSVPVLTDLTGGTLSVAIQKNLENKSEKKGDSYVAIADTRETNNIDKAFDTASRMTVLEAQNGAEGPAFWDTWLTKNKGKVRDKREIKDGQAGKSAGGTPSASGAAPRKSLFG